MEAENGENNNVAMVEEDRQEDHQVNAFSILPDLVWGKVLEKLEKEESSSALQNVMDAFPEVRNQFKKRIPCWYFDRVFPHLYKHLANDNVSANPLRQVCKKWKSVVDDFVGSHISTRPYNHQGLTRRTVNYGEYSYVELNNDDCFKFSSTGDLAKFQETMPAANDPFHGRRVIINNYNPEGDEEFLDAILGFLGSFGEFIVDLDLKLGVYDTTETEHQNGDIVLTRILGKIEHCLESVPLLRTLRIRLSIPNLLFQHFCIFHAPYMPNLETLFIDEDTTDVVADLLVGKNRRHLKRLEILSEPWTAIWYKFPVNLVDLELRFETRCIIGVNRLEWELSEENFDLSKDLKRITISCDAGEYIDVPPRLPLAWLLSLIAPVKKNLEEVIINNICFSMQENEDHSKLPTKLVFPNVKYLKMWDFEANQCYTLLEMLPNLEHLALVACTHFNTDNGDTEQSHLGIILKSLMHTNFNAGNTELWNMRPNLKMVTIYNEFGKIVRQLFKPIII